MLFRSLEFRYHMYGHHIDRLEVFTVPTGSQSYTRRWDRSKQIDQNWHEGRVTLERLNTNDEVNYINIVTVLLCLFLNLVNKTR